MRADLYSVATVLCVLSLLTGASTPASAADEAGNYVIIVPDSSFISAVAPLQAWKTQIGFTVHVVTLSSIYSQYNGDNAERIWLFLHDRYPIGRWGIRYVLLVGDLDRLPMRMLYPDGGPGSGEAYGSDFYYANLSMTNWDLDGDNRWGEFTNDRLNQDYDAEVLVGRIPFSNPTIVAAIANNIVAFEQDIGGWKRNALLAHGIMDYGRVEDPTVGDMAPLAERLTQDFFAPFHWTVVTEYEEGGLRPSPYAHSQRLSQPNFENSSNLEGVVNATTHGSPGAMISLVFTADVNGNGVADATLGEEGDNLFSQEFRIASHPTSGLVFLCGCETGAIIRPNDDFNDSTLRSRYLITETRSSLMVKEYLANGAPAVIGSTAGIDYDHRWDGPDDPQGYGQTLNYLFYKHLIDYDQRAGDAFYAAQEDYVRQHHLRRGIRVFNYFGDPALILKGIEDRPGGGDTLIKEGTYHDYAADYVPNGDMYVAVLSSAPDKTPGLVNIYRSTDHGQHWSGWTWIEEPDEPILDLATLVGAYRGPDSFTDTNILDVFYTTPSGRVVVARINRDNPDLRSKRTVANEPRWAINISAARDLVPLSVPYNIYVAWAFTDLSGVQQVRAYRTPSNGSAWTQIYQLANAFMPHIEAGPNSRVHLAMLTDNDENDVLAVRSLDGGQVWDMYVHDLTGGDGALQHTAPIVAVSADATAPGVWVVYGYEYQHPVAGPERDLRFAYSSDGGLTWSRDRRLSSDVGVEEWLADTAGIRTLGNRWVNLAFSYDPWNSTGHQRNIIWRWASGGLPIYWAPQRIVNDFNGAAPYADPPVVVYSPGSSASGSGVVYGGANRTNVYFSAPWLAGTSAASYPITTAEQNLASDIDLLASAPAGMGTESHGRSGCRAADLGPSGDPRWRQSGQCALRRTERHPVYRRQHGRRNGQCRTRLPFWRWRRVLAAVGYAARLLVGAEPAAHSEWVTAGWWTHLGRRHRVCGRLPLGGRWPDVEHTLDFRQRSSLWPRTDDRRRPVGHQWLARKAVQVHRRRRALDTGRRPGDGDHCA